jgi:hypothetical protein
MPNQVARLFLRGSFISQMRDFTKEQLQEMSNYIEEISNDSALAHAKLEFCNALKRTIGNEYCNKEVAMADYDIAIMKAVIAALYGCYKKPPVPHVLEKGIQRKKYFQTFVFEYLKQILRENKRPTEKLKRKAVVTSEEAAIRDIKKCLIKLSEEDKANKSIYLAAIEGFFVEGNSIYVRHWFLPLEFINHLSQIRDKYLSYGTEILLDDERITVKSDNITYLEVDDTNKVFIQFSNFEHNSDEKDDSYNHYLEFEMSETKSGAAVMDEKESDSITSLRSSLPPEATEVVELIINPPIDYIDQYGTRCYKSHIAKYLGKSNKEVDRLMSIIKYHMMAEGIGLD